MAFRGEKQSDCMAHLFCKYSSCVWCMQLLKMHDYGLDVAFLSAAGTWECVDRIFTCSNNYKRSSRENSLERAVGDGLQCNCRPCVCEPTASGAEVGDRGGTKGPGDLCRIHKGLA